VFERRVLNRIDAGGFNFPIRGLLTLPEEITWTCRPIPRSKFLQESDFIEQITKAIQKNEELHLVPSAPNFKAVDSILYVATNKSGFMCKAIKREQDCITDTQLGTR